MPGSMIISSTIRSALFVDVYPRNSFDFIYVIVVENPREIPALIIHLDDEIALRQAILHIQIMIEKTLNVKQVGADPQKKQ